MAPEKVFLDEIRISNTVRNFQVPPFISGVTELENQSVHQNYPIEATIQTIGDNEVTTAALHYRVDQGSWQELTMQEGAEDRYVATIPSQSAGSRVKYWIEAESDVGKRAIRPKQAITDSTYYRFGVWERYSKILHYDFEDASNLPFNQAPYTMGTQFHGDSSSIYGPGDEGNGDTALSFTVSEESWLEVNSPFLGLSEFALSFKFYAADSVPPEDTRLLAKGSRDALYLSNYQVYFDPNGTLRPAIFTEDNDLDSCGSYTGGCLVLDDSEHGTVQANTWYRVEMGIRPPDTSGSEVAPGIIFSRLVHLDSDSVVGETLHEVNAGATPNSSSLKIGGVGNYREAPYFNGRIDDLSLYNYLPNSFIPDSVHTASDPPTELPSNVKLHQNYPNPFNPTTRISYRLPRASNVELTVYNLVGRKIATLVDGRRRAGNHAVTFNGQQLASGLYIYRLQTQRATLTRKMILMK